MSGIDQSGVHDRRLSVIVRGHVQGVYFRFFTQQEAKRLELTGWVANQADGSVKVVAQGQTESLRRLVRWLERGSNNARVERVEVSWVEPTNSFSVSSPEIS